MIRVIVEAVPGGIESLKYTIAESEIVNISEYKDECEYQYEIKERPRTQRTEGWRVRRGNVRHNREDGVWDLIARTIRHSQKKKNW